MTADARRDIGDCRRDPRLRGDDRKFAPIQRRRATERRQHGQTTRLLLLLPHLLPTTYYLLQILYREPRQLLKPGGYGRTCPAQPEPLPGTFPYPRFHPFLPELQALPSFFRIPPFVFADSLLRCRFAISLLRRTFVTNQYRTTTIYEIQSPHHAGAVGKADQCLVPTD